MKVRCVRTKISPHVEKLTGFSAMYADALVAGNEYDALGIYFQNESSVYRAHVAFVILVDIYVLGLFHEGFFEVVEPGIPRGWEFRSFECSAAIQPSLFYQPGFSEDLFEGEPNARRQFEELIVELGMG